MFQLQLTIVLWTMVMPCVGRLLRAIQGFENLNIVQKGDPYSGEI